MKLAIVVGNPNPKSRTLVIAEAVANTVGVIVGETSRLVIDLIDIAGELFDPKSPRVDALKDQVSRSEFLVIASPTYKAAYTGLLKAFLDRYDTNGLGGTIAIPVMTGGSLVHSLAPEMVLRPLLVELGASVPTQSLYIVTSQMSDLPQIVEDWVVYNQAELAGAAYARRHPSNRS